MKPGWGRARLPAFRPRHSRVRGSIASRGQSMVEFALILPLFLLFILGIIVFALAIHTIIDYNGAIAAGIRQATLINYATGNASLNDDGVGQVLFQSMRSDNPDRANYYDIRLVESRAHPDADTDAGDYNAYENFYSYVRSNHSFSVDPYLYISQNLGNVPTPCQYFYGAHSTGGVAYLDQSERIQIDASDPHLQTALSIQASLSTGCGRTTNDATVLTCANNGQDAAVSPHHLCYYYPEERINTMDPMGEGNDVLPDLLQADINYTFRPLGVFTGPLDFGFALTATSRARIEPVGSTQ